MGVKFMREPCQKALQVRLEQALKQMQETYLEEVRSHLKTPEGIQDLKEGELKALAHVLVAEVIGGPWATIDAFGTGTKMDTANPALDDYLFNTAKGWNPARKDLAIRGRPAGTYTDIFGRQRKSSGALEGRNLEENPPEKGRFDTGKFDPIPPSHAFTVAMAWMRIGTIQKILRDAIATFPFHQYIIATKE